MNQSAYGETNTKSNLYKTNYQELGPNWLMMGGQNCDIKTAKIPTYSEIGKKIPNFRKEQKLLKNQTVAERWKESQTETLDALSQEKRKLDQNALRAKKFPVSAENFQYPEHGLNIGNPFYHTSYMVIGKLKPSNFEVAERYYPVNRNFTGQFGGGNFKFDGLNTSSAFSKVHKLLDEY